MAEIKMVSLTKKEIMAELRKFGISIPSELKSYFREYKKYYRLQQPDDDSSQRKVIPMPVTLHEIDALSYYGTEHDGIDSSLPSYYEV